MSSCPSCGHENQEGSKFCSACGTSLDTGGATLREERKIVTVLFADLVGFTAQAERLDPEDVRALLAPYHARLRAELERFGGTVEKFIGDAVMALFGAPVAHEDDPERAVRAALAIRDWVLEDDELQLRIAVNTGEALVALGAQPSAGEGMASGDVVNVAARLQTAAPVNGILVGEATYRATRDAIDYHPAEAVEAKGKPQPIPVWEAVAPRSALGVDVVQAGRTPLIGRAQELTLLLDTAERVRSAREPQLITLVGVPGIGKSRLTFELFNALTQDDDVLWRQGRCLPYGEGVAFWAIGEIVKSHAEIFESDPAPRVEQKLRRAVSGAVADEHEAQRIIRAFRPLVGLTTELTFNRDEGQTEAFAAWRHFFEALAERRPLVLVLEDLHWGDDQLLDFVDELVDWAADVPLLVLCTARPELLERRPDWGGGKLNATTLSLRPLSHDDTAGVLAANLERPMLEAELQGAVLERAGGNPLYAEQYARMLAESSDASELPLPETVQAIVASRLDGLAIEDKELLHDGAVHGKVFWAGAVAVMTGGDARDVERRLHALERKEFLRRERRSAVAGETQYAFRHMLVRDVAYGQIPRKLRVEKHRLAAEWIGSLGEHREDHVELLAGHYERALEFARASGTDERALVDPARLAFRAAGERADRLGAWTAGIRFFRNALELWPADDEERPRLLLQLADSLSTIEEGGVEEAAEARDHLLARGDLEYAARAEITLGDIAFDRGQGQKARVHAERALELTSGLPASESKAIVVLTSAWRDYLAGNPERALAKAQEARAIAEQVGAAEQLVWALQLVGGSRIDLGDNGGVEDVGRAVALARELDAPKFVPVALNLAVMLFELGWIARGSELAAEARAESARLGHLPTLTWADVQRMRERYWNGDWDNALRLANDMLATEGEHARFFRQRTVRSQIYLARGRVPEALADANDAVAVGRSVGDAQALHSALAVSSRVNLAAGARGAALEALDEVLERIAAGGSHMLSAFLPDLVVTAVDLERIDAFRRSFTTLRKRTPWIDAAVAFVDGDYLTAAERYAEIGSRPDEAYARLRRAAALVSAARRTEAEEELSEALAFFRSVGASRYVSEAEALLAVPA